MDVALFDSTFAHDLGSTAGRPPSHVTYRRGDLAYEGVALFVDGWLYAPEVELSKAKVKLGWLHEPPGLIPGLYLKAPEVVHNFERILTYSGELLAQPGFEFAPYGGVWVPDDQWGVHPKSRLCSMLYGVKNVTAGHKLRPRVANAIRHLSTVDFYGAEGQVTPYGWGTKLLVHRDYAFSIVIEADRIDNLFTEWTLDAFALGTVPIVWAAPNLSYYFDERGFLEFETVDDCVYIVRGLNARQYRAMLPYVQNNLELARQYASSDDWLYTNVLRRYE